MLFVDRSDGRRVGRRHFFRAIVPYVMRSRAQAAVYLSREIDIENALAWLREKKRSEPELGWSLFALVLAAGVRTFALKPRLNGFVHRRALYARNTLEFSFIVKQDLSESAFETSAKVAFEPDDDARTVARRLRQAIAKARSGEAGPAEREMRFLHRLPGFKGIATAVFRLLDALNLAPPSMIASDPLFASGVFANLGSIGLDAPLHHLYEWGTASVFVALGRTIGRLETRPDGSLSRRRVLGLSVTVDERIADGVYFAHAASLFRRLIQKPELLELPLSSPEFGTAALALASARDEA